MVHATEQLELVLVRDEDVDCLKQLGWKFGGRSRIQDRYGADGARLSERRRHDIEWHFELGQDNFTLLDGRGRAGLIRPRHHDDRVLSGVRNQNERSTGRLVDGDETAGIDARVTGDRREGSTRVISADRADEAGPRASASRRDCLVQPLAAGMLGVAPADQGLPRCRMPRRRRDEIEIRASKDEDASLRDAGSWHGYRQLV